MIRSLNMGNRFVPIIITVFLLAAIVCVLEGLRFLSHPVNTSVYDEPLRPAPKTENPLDGIGEQFYVNERYRSHLPLVLIDTGDSVPPVNTRYSAVEDRMIPIPGVEPYVNGSIRFIDSGRINRPGDPAQAESFIMIKRRGNSSMVYNKAQYLVKLVTESGEDNYLNLLQLGEECEWVLNGSMADKSMIRNYLAYRLASKVIPFTPDSRYCEVLYREGDHYRYDGVYLLIESIRQGVDRVNIPRYRSSDPFPSYLVRRDRLNDSAITLNTYLTDNGISRKYLSLLYPGKNDATPQTINYVRDDMDRVERVLYSDEPSIFTTYPRYIDRDSFIDYFIINEFLGSYDAGWHSTYMYKIKGGKLKMGPVWDFDNALDNYRLEPLNTAVTAFQERPLFERLMLDMTFLKKMEKRFAELRRGPLSSGTVYKTIDEITMHLGPAIEREWFRWANFYTIFNPAMSMQNWIDENGDEIIRNTQEHRQEIYRLKTSLSEHGYGISTHLPVFEWYVKFRTGLPGFRNLLLLTMLIVFLIPLLYLSRR